MTDRAIVFPRLSKNETPIGMHLRIKRSAQQRLPVVRQSLTSASGVGQGNGEIVMRLAVVGMQLQRAFVVNDGFVVSSQRRQRDSEIVFRSVVSGLKSQ